MTSMSAFMTDVGLVFTSFTDKIPTVFNLFMTTPILLLPLGVFVIGAIVGLFKRFVG